MRIVKEILSLVLGLSALVGFQILVSDTWLWSAAPSHAFGLIGFVLIDIVLAAVVLTNRTLAAVGAFLVSIIQFGAMIADRTSGQPMGVPAAAFRSYLLSDLSYVVLLGIQIMILVVSITALALPVAHRHFRWRLKLPSRRPHG